MKENEIEYCELYNSIAKSLSKHLIDTDCNKRNEIALILIIFSFKLLIIDGMDIVGFNEFYPAIQNQFNYLYDEAHDEKGFFSKLDEVLNDFRHLNVNEFLESKDAMKTLLRYGGVEESTINILIKNLK